MRSIAEIALSLAAETVSLWKALAEVSALRGAHSLWHWFRATLRIELLMVVGADIAATSC